jgi:hypothetical protein
MAAGGLEDLEVGHKHFGSMVTRIKQEVKEDTDEKFHILRWVTLRSGAVLKEEYWVTKGAKGGEDQKKYSSGESSIDPSLLEADETDGKGAARAKARALMEQRKAEKKAAKDTEKKNEAAAKKDAKKSKKGKKKRRKDKPVELKVHSKNDPNLPPALPEAHRGVWKMPPGEEGGGDDDDAVFEPQDVLICEFRAEPDSSSDPGLPRGVCTYSPGCDPLDDDDPVELKKVYSENDPNLPPALPDAPRGVWKMTPGEEGGGDDDDAVFEPQDVLICESRAEPDSSSDPGLPPRGRGVCTYSAGCDPLDDDDDDEWRPSGVFLLPPNAEDSESSSFDPKGVYTYSPESLNRDWPPSVITGPKRQNRQVEELRKIASEEPVALKVYSKSDPDLPPALPDVPRGVWKLPLFGEDDGEEEILEPQGVLIYKPGDQPDSSSDPSLPRGVWTYSTGSDLSDDDVDEWRPGGDVFLLPPNRDVSDDFNPKHQGIYTYDPKSLNREWPPQTKGANNSRQAAGKLKIPNTFGTSSNWASKPANVVPKSKLPMAKKFRPESGPITGVWEQHKKKDIDDTEWEPMDGTVQNSKDKLDTDQPNGVFAVSNEIQSDEDGLYNPKDFLILPPGEKTSEKHCQPVGVWTSPPGRLGSTWPPTKASSAHPRNNLGKLPNNKSQISKDGTSNNVIVFTPRHVPNKNIDDDVARGVWRSMHPLPDWEPQTVTIYSEDDEEPQDLEDEIHGVWGTDPTAEPDEDGQWKPKDLWFCPPGEVPEARFVPKGTWAYPPGKPNTITWPPPTTKPARNSQKVGKLPKWQTSNDWKSNKAIVVGKLPKWQTSNDWKSNKAIVFSLRGAPERNSGDTSRGIWKSSLVLPAR